METMTKLTKSPSTDSIEALADFWDSHDLTDFEDGLEEVSEPVFMRQVDPVVPLELPDKELAAIKRIAQEQHTDYTTLMRDWVLEKLYYTEMMRRVTKEFQAQ